MTHITYGNDKKAIMECLAINRIFQKIIREELKAIEEHVISIRNSTHVYLDYRSSRPIRYFKSFFNSGYFQTGNFELNLPISSFTDNPEVQNLLEISHLQKYWSQKDIASLKEGVVKETLRRHLEPVFLRIAEIKKLENSYHKSALLRRLKAEIEQIKSNTNDHLIAESADLDFGLISHLYNAGHTAFQCQLRWMMEEHPKINSDPFSSEEDAKLKELAEKHNFKNWIDIAHELQTNRTHIQCLRRYRCDLEPNRVSGKFSPSEDEMLIHMVNLHGRNWQKISCFIESRTAAQLMHRYTYTLIPNLNKGSWTKEEDEKLVHAVLTRRSNIKWRQLAVSLECRSAKQVRNRCQLILGPKSSSSSEAWTEEEDQTLMSLVENHGRKWSKFSKLLQGRSEKSCLQRYSYLLKLETSGGVKSQGKFKISYRRKALIQYMSEHQNLQKIKELEKSHSSNQSIVKCDVSRESDILTFDAYNKSWKSLGFKLKRVYGIIKRKKRTGIVNATKKLIYSTISKMNDELKPNKDSPHWKIVAEMVMKMDQSLSKLTINQLISQVEAALKKYPGLITDFQSLRLIEVCQNIELVENIRSRIVQYSSWLVEPTLWQIQDLSSGVNIGIDERMASEQPLHHLDRLLASNSLLLNITSQ